MAFDPRVETLGSYKPTEFRLECFRCRRSAPVERYPMIQRFGAKTTLLECARQIAASKGCNLAAIHDGPGCSVQVFETPVWTWARLEDAKREGWSANLTCHRRFAGLKAAKSCPESVRLHILSLVAAFGDDFHLHRLPPKLKCPSCGTASVEIEWVVPEPPNSPAPLQDAPQEPIRLKPRGAALARTKLGVVKE